MALWFLLEPTALVPREHAEDTPEQVGLALQLPERSGGDKDMESKSAGGLLGLTAQCGAGGRPRPTGSHTPHPGKLG